MFGYSKVPLVLYNERHFKQQIRREEEGLPFDRIYRDSCQNNAANMSNIVRVLRKNEARLKFLAAPRRDSLSE
jgi:hypothetical protein